MSELIKMRPKIHIDICTHRIMDPFFVNSMFYMLGYMRQTGMEYEINSHAGVSNLVGGRQNRVHEAIKSDCTHMLMVDDDMAFAMNSVHKMLAEINKLVTSGMQHVAMGVNYCRKSPDTLYYTAKGMGDEWLESKGATGVVEASACGLGMFLVETAVLRQIPEPHFEINWMPNVALYNNSKEMFDLLHSENCGATEWQLRRASLIEKINSETATIQEHQGEDFFFTRKLRDHGVRVFIDQDISQATGHAGSFVYSFGSYPNVAKT